MSYIVMGKDECGYEFRPSSRTWASSDDAYNELEKLREQYQEARGLWVEPLHDKDYYMSQRYSDYWDDHEHDY